MLNILKNNQSVHVMIIKDHQVIKSQTLISKSFLEQAWLTSTGLGIKKISE